MKSLYNGTTISQHSKNSKCRMKASRKVLLYFPFFIFISPRDIAQINIQLKVMKDFNFLLRTKDLCFSALWNTELA